MVRQVVKDNVWHGDGTVNIGVKNTATEKCRNNVGINGPVKVPATLFAVKVRSDRRREQFVRGYGMPQDRRERGPIISCVFLFAYSPALSFSSEVPDIFPLYLSPSC